MPTTTLLLTFLTRVNGAVPAQWSRTAARSTASLSPGGDNQTRLAQAWTPKEGGGGDSSPTMTTFDTPQPKP